MFEFNFMFHVCIYKKKRVHTRLNTNFYYIYYYRIESWAFLVVSYACHNLIAPTPQYASAVVLAGWHSFSPGLNEHKFSM